MIDFIIYSRLSSHLIEHRIHTSPHRPILNLNLTAAHLTAPLLATGATAVVLSHQDLAVKLFPSSPTALAAFAHERDLYEHLNFGSQSEYILQYFGTWDTGIVLERMDVMLRQRLQTSQPVSSEMQDLWIVELAKGLAFLHQKGVVHGDVSARNVLLTCQHIRICDFARARLGGGEASARYEVRNQKPGMEACVQTDIFAFGSVVFEIVTGGVVFAGLSDGEVRERFEKGEWPVEEVGREGLRRVVEGCWKGRYRCFEEVLGNLEEEEKERRQLLALRSDAVDSIKA